MRLHTLCLPHPSSTSSFPPIVLVFHWTAVVVINHPSTINSMIDDRIMTPLSPFTIVGSKASATVAVTNTPLGATTPSTNDNGASPGDILTYPSHPPHRRYTHIVSIHTSSLHLTTPIILSPPILKTSTQILSPHPLFTHPLSTTNTFTIYINTLETPRQRRAQRNWQKNWPSRVEKNW